MGFTDCLASAHTPEPKPSWPVPNGWRIQRILFFYGYKVVPPSYVCWFIIPLTIDISPINHSYWSVKPT